MRIRTHWMVLAIVTALAVQALSIAGCAKKSPAPPPPPPAPSQTTTPSTPSNPSTPSTDTNPSTPPSTASTITAAELQAVYFTYDSWTLDDAARAALDSDARLLRDNPGLSVRVEGHCDERGTVEYNMSLGEKRAAAVHDYLVGAGVAESRLSTLSYGKERPAVDGHDDAAWAKNRRVEFSKP